MSNNFDLLLKNINNQKYKFINSDFKFYIINVINNFFPLLNKKDKYILNLLTIFLIDLICYKYNFKNNLEYINQWKQNNNRDIKSVVLLILPFFDDKNNNKITDLNHLLYSKNDKYIDKKILRLNRNSELFEEYFKYSNMGIGLLYEDIESNSLLNLYDDNNDKLIYKIIYHNFLGLLQTLEIMNGKYYINWINIVPFHLNNYYDNIFYIKTIKTIRSFKYILNEKILTNLLLNYNGLWIGDYYNILKIKFYEDLKKIKWLIFPYENDTEKYYLINKLNDLLNLDFIINCNYNNYYELSNNEKINFYNNCNSIDIDNNSEIIKYLLIYLINNSNDNVFDKYTNFKLNIEEDNDIKEYDNNATEIIKNIKNKLIKITFEDIIKNNISELWNFLNETMGKFKNSSIYKYLVTDNKINNNYYYEPFNNNLKSNDIYITNIKNKLNLKNIYNIAKSLSHNNLNEWEKLSDNYLSLNINEKINFFNKINNYENYFNWINLKSNLKRQYYNFDNQNYNNKMIEILKAFYYSWHNIIFEEMITNGLLNYFNVNLNITNKELLPKNDFKMKDKRKKLTKEIFKENLNNFNECYYYLTNDKYKNLNKIKSNHNIKLFENYNEYDYFELMIDEQEWIYFYAMDWISQINFFHHYIYHQVLYVTGATGQGKSTQLPKLLLYSLKVIDYKNNGKVICTEPRIPPTYNNSSRISEELGVPLDEISENQSIKLKTDNYYIQYKHSEDQHINNNINYGFIKITTDGTLFEELKSNLIMKKKINDNNYINENVYDIIMIDESHEHGTNMDLIITLSRYTCFFNNQIRLIITSATMDDDEPIYRRYFKMINDKLLFPIKNRIIDPFTYDLILLNPEYMDRRFHISPPGETTQYKVDEYYLSEDITFDNNLSHKEISNKVQLLGYERIIEICNKYPTGEILFFANGMNEILKAVKYLNDHIPINNIALPYFSELHSNYKKIIEKIDTQISTIKNKKENIAKEWGNVFIEDNTVTNNNYKRAIIVSTNIAEASLTIPRLTFVIDNGYAKINKYYERFNINILEVDLISESSRLQRKGRVGRLSDGQVFFLYKKDERKIVKPKYKITQENFSNLFIDLLINENKKFTIQRRLNPNLKFFNEYLIKHNYKITNEYLITKNDYFTSNLLNIHFKNYYINELDIDEYFLNDDEIGDIDIHGFTSTKLLDVNGNFYLIHYF